MTPRSADLPGRYPGLMLALATLMWSGNHIVGRAMSGHVPPVGLSALRWALAAIVILPLAWPHLARDLPRMRAKAGIMVFLSLVGAGIFGTSQLIGLKLTSALNVAVLNSVAPALILVACVAIFHDPLVPLQVLGLAISLAGALLIVVRGMPAALLDLTLNAGDVLVFLNMMLWAVYCASLRLKPDVHPWSFMLALSVVSSLANVPFWVVEHAYFEQMTTSLATVGAIVYTGIFTSVIAYAMWSSGVERMGATRAGAYLHLVPLYGALLAWSFLGERIFAYHIVGFLLIIAGVSLAARRA
jgi:drug/metabolite transporter (DMT)-like permease